MSIAAAATLAVLPAARTQDQTVNGSLNVNRTSTDGATLLNINGAAGSTGYRIVAQNNGTNVLRVQPNGNLLLDVLGGGDGALVINNGGSGPAALFNGGNVGIGTTSPANLLEVNGNIGLAGDFSSLHFLSAAGPGDLYLDVEPGTRTLRTRNWNVGSPNVAATSFHTGSLFAEGQVGIGTLAPAANLEVYAGADTGSILWGETIRNNGNADTTDYGAGLKLKISNDESPYELYKWAGLAAVAGTGYANRTDMAFYVDPTAASAPVEKMRLTGDGKLGIGTTSPGEVLDVIGRIRSTGGLAYQTADGVQWWMNGLCNGPGILLQSNGAAGGPSNRRGSLGWMDNNGVKYEYMTWTDSGNVGIGTLNPSAKLDVVGDANIQGNLTVAGSFTAPTYVTSSGALTGGSSGLALNAGGTNQDVTITPSGSGSVVVNGTAAVVNGTLFAGTIASGTSDQTSARHYVGYVNALPDGGSGTAQFYTVGTLDLSNAANTSGLIEGVLSVGRSYQNNPEYRFALTYYKATGSATANLSVEYSENLGAVMLFRSGDVFKLVASNGYANQVGLYYDVTQYQGTDVIGSSWIRLSKTAADAESGTAPPPGFSESAANEFVFSRIKDTGNVGIGTANPDKTLTVKGTVHATEVVVDTTVAANDVRVRPAAWADNVLQRGHRLPALAAVARQIEATGHLPGMPSAQEVAAHGVSVADMQAKLLAKIEELTLRQIEQEKLLKQQGKLLARQGNQIQSLQQQNASLRTRRN